MNIQKAILFTGAQNSYRMNKKRASKPFTKLKFCDIILNTVKERKLLRKKEKKMDVYELSANIAVLDEMLNSETIPFKHYSAIKFAYNMLCVEKWKMESNMRKPEDFPYCSKCGKIYKKLDTDDIYVKMLVPQCDCEVAPKFGNRPAEKQED